MHLRAFTSAELSAGNSEMGMRFVNDSNVK